MISDLDPRVIRRITDMAAVYRMFDRDGKLLYVGKTSCAGRFDDHAVKRFFPLLATITLEWHDTEASALVAERTAIVSERPRYNIAGKQGAQLAPLPLLTPPLIRDVLGVLRPREERIWTREAAARLATARSADYGDWNARRLGDALTAHGVRTRQLWINGANARGFLREDISARARLGRPRSRPSARPVKRP